MPRVFFTIVAWNSMRVLPATLASIAAQTVTDYGIIIVDNASSDGVVPFVREHYPHAVLLRNTRNLGFARGHNQAIELARSFWAKEPGNSENRFIVLTNPDLRLAENCLAEMLHMAEAHPQAGSVAPKLKRLFEKMDGEFSESNASNIIDSAGIGITRYGLPVDRGAGAEDGAAFAEEREVFGPPGALALYRLEALEDVVKAGGVFDEQFFAYKEDIDLAWRLRLLGWECWYAPRAVSHHVRSAYGSVKRSFRAAWRERRKKSAFVNTLSYRNQQWLLVKNLDVSTFLLYGPLLVGYEILKFCYVLLWEPRVLVAFSEALRGIPDMVKKRRAFLPHRRVPAGAIRRWFGAK